jgi:hypothetical protein
MESTNSSLLWNAGVATTLADALLALSRGRIGSSVFLLVAAVVSSRIPGVGTLASVGLRVYRRLNASGRAS